MSSNDRIPREPPELLTPRLLLRAHTLADAADMQRYAGAREVAATTLTIPHPYLEGMAEAWLAEIQLEFVRGKNLSFAITRREDQQFMGAISLEISREDDRAELGYYLGVPFWGQGYCTKAAQQVLHYGFTELKLHRIHARHFAHNPASGQIMQKLGMRYEGCLRQHVKKWGEYIDVALYGILKEDL